MLWLWVTGVASGPIGLIAVVLVFGYVARCWWSILSPRARFGWEVAGLILVLAVGAVYLAEAAGWNPDRVSTKTHYTTPAYCTAPGASTTTTVVCHRWDNGVYVTFPCNDEGLDAASC